MGQVMLVGLLVQARAFLALFLRHHPLFSSLTLLQLAPGGHPCQGWRATLPPHQPLATEKQESQFHRRWQQEKT
jgi:hypothetical protein